ncbi:MAG: YfcE family phosphodiesterase, partial [Nitrososphaeraceae archaeon]
MLVYAMKIGLISDTHDNIQNIQKAITLFNDKHVKVVIHAGDIVSPETVKAFDGMRLIGVLGNNDLQIHELTDAFDKIGGQLKGEFCEIEQGKLRLAVYHGTDSRRKKSLIECGKYDVIICGHTH